MSDRRYCPSLFEYKRFTTREVKIGNVGVGGVNPIRLQSMTTADTMDTEKSVEESIRMIDAGCEIVRLTAPSKKEAENLAVIKARLLELNYDTPLVADIHFTPNAAEIAADYVEKVRVNPGNYADKKKFEVHDYSDESYADELERIRAKFTPLVLKCKANGVAMRIGTNHGSLSDRILSRYGDTPLGMVESAMEFIRICRDHDYHDIVVSMKASNPQIMIHAYRLLVHTMMEQNMNYPLHLGVTEAGDGEDGRIKSAVGIGTLLEDGIGDTIRVSLTEDPEHEIPVAKMLADRYKTRVSVPFPKVELAYNPFEYHRHHARETNMFGDHHPPAVIVDLSTRDHITEKTLFAIGYGYSVELDKWNIHDQACDFIFAGDLACDFDIPGTLGIIHHYAYWKEVQHLDRRYPLIDAAIYMNEDLNISGLRFVRASISDLSDAFIGRIQEDLSCVLVLETTNPHGMAEQRMAFSKLIHSSNTNPVVISRSYQGLSDEEFMLYSSTDVGGLMVDGLGDGVFIRANGQSPKLINDTSFGILQATRMRISRTEYISCPSCGRTLFDLQETTAKIRARTNHLKGVKIGIMGCIVNGPGEMADADYGYVGTGPGKITLYKEQEVVKRNVNEDDAVDELIELIQSNGDWVDPS